MSIRHNQQEKYNLIQGLEPISLVSDEYWYRALTYSAVSDDLRCSQYQSLQQRYLAIRHG